MPRALPLSAKPYPLKSLLTSGRQRTFRGRNLDQIAFPLGGIGAGTISIGGAGYLTDLSLFHKPAMAQPYFGFAALHAKPQGGKAVTRVLEGPTPASRIYSAGRYAHGRCSGTEGLPRCQEASFRGEFPLAFIDLKEPSLPVDARITAWSPFIPLDDRASGMPMAVLEYTFTNRGRKSVSGIFSYSFKAPGGPAARAFTFRTAGGGSGIEYLPEGVPQDDPKYGTFVVATTAAGAKGHCAWFRGGFFDPLTVLWKELSAGKVIDQPVSPPDPEGKFGGKGQTGATLQVPLSLAAGQTVTIPLLICWHYPNNPLRSGQVPAPAPAATPAAAACNCAPGSACCPDPLAAPSQPWYATQWSSAWDVACEAFRTLPDLRRRTAAFHQGLFSTTAPACVLDAVSANLGILRSPTVLRQKSGAVWSWEGCNVASGCCAGNCTHVWNYAQAMPHLFPALERTLRNDELDFAMDERGHASFRSAFPQAPTVHVRHAAADGQLGGIMKLCRDWMIGGDDPWLRSLYPKARQSMDYCIAEWDPKGEGWLVQPHHNTYDIEFWGPDGMCSSFYLGALAAMVQMGRRLGEDVARYQALLACGMKRVDKELFNGRWFIQKIMGAELGQNPEEVQTIMGGKPNYSPEAVELLRKEGPKYQYGKGCLADGVIGQWHARMYGLGDVLDRGKTRRHLASVFAHNFRPTLRDHANPRRPTYALDDEAGLLICTWPAGGELTLPFVYSNEVWTGIEYQVASHCIYEGLLAEGLTIVKAARDRYEGLKRNPWDEYECGSYYARAMSSYAVLTALFGFRYDMPDGRLTLAPRLPGAKLRTFFSTAGGYGTITIQRAAGGKAKAKGKATGRSGGSQTTIRIEMIEGTLALRELRFETPKGSRFRACLVADQPEPLPVKQSAEWSVVEFPMPLTARVDQPLVLCLL